MGNTCPYTVTILSTLITRSIPERTSLSLRTLSTLCSLIIKLPSSSQPSLSPSSRSQKRSDQRTESPTNNTTASSSLHTASHYSLNHQQNTTRLLPPVSGQRVCVQYPHSNRERAIQHKEQSPDWLPLKTTKTHRPIRGQDESIISPRVHGRVQRG